MKKILITGISGLLGGNFGRLFSKKYEITGTFNSFNPISDKYKQFFRGYKNIDLIQHDLKNEEKTGNILRKISPDILLHTAGITDNIYSENHPFECFNTNVKPIKNIALLCKKIGTKLVYISSDLVFDGRVGNYNEEDKLNPISNYGRSKMMAEKIIIDNIQTAIIIRTSLIYGFSPKGNRSENEKLYNRAKSGEKISLFSNEYRCPIWVNDLSTAIYLLLQKKVEGIFHVAGPEKISRYDFGCSILNRIGYSNIKPSKASIEDYKGSPNRAPDLSLNINKLLNTISIEINNPSDGISHLKYELYSFDNQDLGKK